MRVYEDPAALRPAEFTSPVVTVGVFDGLHAGHRELLSELRAWAARAAGESVVITFRAQTPAYFSISRRSWAE